MLSFSFLLSSILQMWQNSCSFLCIARCNGSIYNYFLCGMPLPRSSGLSCHARLFSISRAAKHQNRSVFEASMKLCTGVDPSKGSWKKIPPTYSRPLVAAIVKFNMAAILDIFSAITPKLRQAETFCLLLTLPHFKGQGIP